MSHDHHHDHEAGDLPAAIDLSVPDSELSPADLSRRTFLRRAGLLGAGAAATSMIGAAGVPVQASPGQRGGLRWLAGDHHIHTQYSPDAVYRVIDQAEHARAYGLDWMVITDHGNATHARIGVDLTYPDVVATREQYPDLLIYQGLEWNIPAAEHGTVFVHPGRNELALLKEFENYSRTHVGATEDSYAAVMKGLRAGRVWVDHGSLVRGLDIRVRDAGDRRPDRGTPLGGVAAPRRGTRLELVIDIDLATTPNWAQFVPVLARVDVILGQVTGPVPDPDTFTTPGTRVVQAFEVGPGSSSGRVSFSYPLGRADQPYYVRIRGTDGLRSAPGMLGADVDPHGPVMDEVGNADPWQDLWFYTNPIFVLPRS